MTRRDDAEKDPRQDEDPSEGPPPTESVPLDEPQEPADDDRDR